jgi:NAD(P)-dependent dehydrogenase (short-subunit alcohol dehydrogenase family)
MPPSTSNHQGNVAVFGASGHTGRFVVAELERRAINAVLVGRNVEKLSRLAAEHPGFEVRAASMEASSLDRALAGASLVIHCAGPFVDTAEPVINAALRAHAHYMDVSAEQRVTLATFERFAEARTAGVVLIPSMGFFGGLGDLLATAAMGDWTSADEIRVVVAMDSWRPTRGTRLTGERNPGPRSVYSNNILAPLKDPPPSLQWHFPLPFGMQDVVAFPLTETIVISRHLQSPEVHAFLNRTALDDIHNPNTPAPTPVDESGRSDQRFLMEAVVYKGDKERRASVAGQDIYAITAPLVVKAAQRILNADVRTTGVRAAGEIFNAEQFLKALAAETPSFHFDYS